MVSPEFADRQLQRLEGLEKFPTQPVARLELLNWLRKHAPSEQAAKDFVDGWLAANNQAPKPCEVYEYFHPPKSYKDYEPSIEIKCQACNDTGFRIVERKDGITAAVRCEECQGNATPALKE